MYIELNKLSEYIQIPFDIINLVKLNYRIGVIIETINHTCRVLSLLEG